MGASVTAYWPNITEAQLEQQPYFKNDCKAWGDWMAERLEHPDVIKAIEDLGCKAILTYTTAGLEDTDVDWVTPEELAQAARTLKEAVHQNRPGIERILKTYELSCNDVDPLEDEFIQDLVDLEAIAEWAAKKGVSRMTLEVNW